MNGDRPNDEPSGQSLCLSCGLCCDGTLFTNVQLVPDDSVLRLRSRGLPIIEMDGKQCFELPCVAHGQGCCSIYADRPTRCREYRCALLRRYEKGRITWADTQECISRVRSIEAKIRTEFTRVAPEQHFTSALAARGLLPSDGALAGDPQLRRAWAPVMMWLSVLLDTAQAQFHGRRTPAGPPEEDIVAGG
ncbi:MAG: YkgJ family cysteine cluster protein [bacterium]